MFKQIFGELFTVITDEKFLELAQKNDRLSELKKIVPHTLEGALIA